MERFKGAFGERESFSVHVMMSVDNGGLLEGGDFHRGRQWKLGGVVGDKPFSWGNEDCLTPASNLSCSFSLPFSAFSLLLFFYFGGRKTDRFMTGQWLWHQDLSLSEALDS